MHDEPFDRTTGEIARAAGVLPDTVRLYADLRLIDSQRLSNGSRIFQRSAASIVKAVKAKRLAHRGIKSPTP